MTVYKCSAGSEGYLLTMSGHERSFRRVKFTAGTIKYSLRVFICGPVGGDVPLMLRHWFGGPEFFGIVND